MKICVLFIGTGRYIELFPQVYESFEKYFLINHEKKYFLFTDSKETPRGSNINIISIPWSGFPIDTLNRYHFFISIKEQLKEFDVIYYCDVDMKIMKPIGNEFLPTKEKSLIAVTHPFYFNISLGTPETRKQSNAYISPEEKRHFYIVGGIQGGSTTEYLSACETMINWIDDDSKNNIVGKFEDESYWNKYMTVNQNLFRFYSPAYCYPSRIYSKGKIIWNIENPEHNRNRLINVPFLKYEPIILCVHKNHKELRKKP